MIDRTKPQIVGVEKLSFTMKFILVMFLFFVWSYLMTMGKEGFIAATVIALGLVGFRIWGFKRCPHCLKNYITKQKTVCFYCWHRLTKQLDSSPD